MFDSLIVMDVLAVVLGWQEQLVARGILFVSVNV